MNTASESAQNVESIITFSGVELSDGTHTLAVGEPQDFYGFGDGSLYYWCDTDNGSINTNPTFIVNNFTVGEVSTDPVYAASIANAPEGTVAKGEAFTADVVLTSDGPLACGQFKLAVDPTIAKITGVTNKLTGESVSFSKTTAVDGSQATVSFYGNDADADDGLTVAQISFEAVADGEARLALSEIVVGQSGNTLDKDLEAPEATVITVFTPYELKDYAGSSYKLLKYQPAAPPAEGKTITYDNKAMYQDDDGYWYCVVASDETFDSSKIVVADGTATKYADLVKGDVNTNGKTNIVDAQIAYDLANNVYSGFEKLDADQIILADVNNTMSIDASDALAIQYYVHYGQFGE